MYPTLWCTLMWCTNYNRVTGFIRTKEWSPQEDYPERLICIFTDTLTYFWHIFMLLKYTRKYTGSGTSPSSVNLSVIKQPTYFILHLWNSLNEEKITRAILVYSQINRLKSVLCNMSTVCRLIPFHNFRKSIRADFIYFWKFAG